MVLGGCTVCLSPSDFCHFSSFLEHFSSEVYVMNIVGAVGFIDWIRALKFEYILFGQALIVVFKVFDTRSGFGAWTLICNGCV